MLFPTRLTLSQHRDPCLKRRRLKLDPAKLFLLEPIANQADVETRAEKLEFWI